MTPSIAIYVIVRHDQKLKPDLRGITWERDFPARLGVVIHHISDGALYRNDINWTVLPEGAAPYRDKRLRVITTETWKHFVTFHSSTRWLLRGLYDMSVNVTNLVELAKSLEKQYNPLTQWVARYGCHYNFGHDYPHGSAICSHHMQPGRLWRILRFLISAQRSSARMFA
jgi:hypothetical protein